MSVNMADEDVLLRNELYYCTHLLNESVCKDERKFLELIEELEEFFICRETGKDVADYLRDNAIKDENEAVNRTYLVRDVDTDELVGFFSLKNGMAIFPDTSGNIITKPSIELSEFAMNEEYLENNPYRKGNGVIIFSDFIVPICKEVNKLSATKFLYVYAINEESLLARYMDAYGFERYDKGLEHLAHSSIRPNYNDDCVFLYQTLN